MTALPGLHPCGQLYDSPLPPVVCFHRKHYKNKESFDVCGYYKVIEFH